jgi:hypothetical protein
MDGSHTISVNVTNSGPYMTNPSSKAVVSTAFNQAMLHGPAMRNAINDERTPPVVNVSGVV